MDTLHRVVGAGTIGAGIAEVGVLAGLSIVADGQLGRKSGHGFYTY